MDVTRPHSSLFLTPELEIARYRYDRVKPLNKFGYNAAYNMVLIKEK
jgi:hypothetical protein